METLSGVKGENSDQDFRSRSRRVGTLAKIVRSEVDRTCAASRTSAFSRSRDNRISSSPSTAKSARCGTSAWPRCKTRCKPPWPARPSRRWSRGNGPSTSRSAGPSTCGKNEHLILDIPVDVIKNRVVVENNPGQRDSSDIGRVGATRHAACRCQLERQHRSTAHVQQPIERAPPALGRPGRAGRRARRARSRAAASSAPALRRSPASKASG